MGLRQIAATEHAFAQQIGGPRDVGFDYYFGISASLDMPPYLYFENERTVEQPTSQIGDIREQRGIFWRLRNRMPLCHELPCHAVDLALI